jgi:predicted O-methyltransferase YrrM
MMNETNSGFNGAFLAQQSSVSEALTLERDLAMMENADGNWDDSEEDEEVELRHSLSKVTLNSACSSNGIQSIDEVASSVDIWDL